jgi:lipoprotein-anchoring transpeptidase ErfK/SrfK
VGPSPSATAPGQSRIGSPGDAATQASNVPAAPASPGTASQGQVPGAYGAASETSSDNDVRALFEDLMNTVDQKLAEGELAEAHLALSSLHGNPKLPVEMSHRVIDLLDQLAGTVIYSREHHLEAPYTVQPSDTMESIAAKYDVPAQVLARINRIGGPDDLQPGQQLKVIRGPFSALVDLENYELTLMLGRRYAGRFPIGVGEDQMRLEGTYTVQGKMPNPPYNGPEGTIPADDPNNPLGEFYIDLGNYVGLHGTTDPGQLHRTEGRGTIRLAERDIDDLYGILSVGSEVVIRR